MIVGTSLLHGSPFVAYTYAYPHKTAYRPFRSPLSLDELWQRENRQALSLYLHVPFCEFRCGFCNLFTQARPEHGLTQRYLDQIRSEAEQVLAALGGARFARLAIGGGTPTFLNIAELEALFRMTTDVLGVESQHVPLSIEASPATVDRNKLQFLRAQGVDRLSLGVQTFHDRESQGLGRPQRRFEVERALSAVRDVGFASLNIDLIYGVEGQSIAAWLQSVRAALEYRPEELYLYPLYVRPLTGLGQLAHRWFDNRLECYRAARDLLCESGYEQVSFRMFRATHAAGETGPVYCCQTDGMVGLGCGARSYTYEVHYSNEYAVGRQGVRAILADYLTRDAGHFNSARYGFRLDADERRRRFLLLSLLQATGLRHDEYASRFGASVYGHFPELGELVDSGLATVDDGTTQLTKAGLERSDAIGPWLYSPRVRQLTEEYECR
jgi:oxygen-independent coproporphyrinogen III oxidase